MSSPPPTAPLSFFPFLPVHCAHAPMSAPAAAASPLAAQLRAAHMERLLRVATCVAVSGHGAALAPLLASARAFYADAQLWAVLARLPGPGGRTRLMCAAGAGNEARAQFLLERGADVNDADAEGRTALMYASRVGGWRPFCHFCCDQAGGAGRLPVVQVLVRWGAALNAVDSKEGQTALIYASEDLRTAAVARFLIASGADVNIASSTDLTALMCACQVGAFDVVHDLVERGADVNAAADYVDIEDCDTALCYACSYGHVAIVRFLVEGVANVHAESSSGTPLMYACRRGRLEVARYLVMEGGVAVNAVSSAGYTALMVACQCGELETAEFLVEAGANVSASTPAGTTALVLASEEGNWDVVSFLLSKKADVNVATEGGRTALMCACEQGHSGTVKELVDSGANQNAATAHGGMTALMFACKGGSFECAELLVGADVNAASLSGGMTALMWACDNGNLRVANLLIARGADRSMTNSSGHTAHDLSAAAWAGTKP